MSLPRYTDLPVAGRVVIVRSDLNVPLRPAGQSAGNVPLRPAGPAAPANGMEVVDDARIRASAPTLRSLSDRGAKVVILAHLGRPTAGDPSSSLAPVAIRCAQILERPVTFVPVVTGPELAAAIKELPPGGLLMCENVRFDARETSSDPAARAALAAEWAALADAYVLDGFGVAHREQASVTGLPALLPHAAGECVLAEVAAFDRVLTDPQRPYAVILGGAKVSDKLGVVGALLATVDVVLIGGGMAFTFLAAQGHSVGASLLEADRVPEVRTLLDEAAARGVRVLLPADLIIATDVTATAPVQTVPADAIPDGWRGLDIGPVTREHFAAECARAATIVWNGPLGVAEIPTFAGGTAAIADAVAQATHRGAFTVIGGGDTAAAIHLSGHADDEFSHVSTGGGASLELLEGLALPGIRSLTDV